MCWPVCKLLEARLLLRTPKTVDKRTGVAKLLASTEDDLAGDRGGWPSTSATETLLIRRAAFLALTCSSIENWLLKQPELVTNGELLGPLKKGLATHQANLARILSALGLKASTPKVPSLDEYLRERNTAAQGADQARGNGATGTDGMPGGALESDE